jgi:hypothetical protein
MRTHILHNADGTPYAFDISNLLLTRNQACKLVSAIPGTAVIRRSRLFRDTDDFCEFKIGVDVFILEEPFGDSSRYWVGPKDGEPSHSLDLVRSAFEAHDSWRAPARNVLILAILLGAVWSAMQVQKFIAQDSCLDSGGRWVRQDSSCVQLGRQ